MCPSDDGNEGSYLIIAVNAQMGKHNQKQWEFGEMNHIDIQNC